MEVIGIVGASFCGSTVFSIALASLPGVIAPGEIHRLLSIKEGHTPYTGWICSKCGPACPVFTRELCDLVTEENLYDVVAEAFGTDPDVLVSSDKSLMQYQRYGRLPDMLLLLMRDVTTHVASLSRTQGDEVEAVRVLKRFYARELDAAEELDVPLVRVSLEAFLDDPLDGLEKLNVLTGGLLPAPRRAPSFAIDYHHSGGNYAAHRAVSGFNRRRPNRRRLVQLTPVQVRAELASTLRRIDDLALPSLLATS